MTILLWIGFGGFLGTILRYLAGVGVTRWLAPSTYPWGTFLVNLLGCLVIGMVAALVEVGRLQDDRIRLFVMVGILGGFTTFSAFGLETWRLLRDGHDALALFNAGAQVILGLFGVWLGFVAVRVLS